MNSRLASSNKPTIARARPKRIEDDPMAQAAPIASTPTLPTIDFDQFIGLILVAVLPALFWTALACVISASVGITLSWAVTGGIAIGITAFLSIIFRALGQNKT